MFSKTPFIPRNVAVKSFLTAFCGLGIFFAISATLSCRWFDYDAASFEAWDILPDDKNHTMSVGLFRYQTSPSGQCIQYEPLFVGDVDGMSMMYAAQICVILGPIFACTAWLLAMVAVNKYPTVVFLLMATVVQCASVVASMSWCEGFGACPWQFGSITNTVAAAIFFVSSLLGFWGLVKEDEAAPPPKDAGEEDGSMEEEEADDDHDHPSIIDVESAGYDEESLPKEEPELEAEPEPIRQIIRRLSSRLENYWDGILGTRNPVIVNAVLQQVGDAEQKELRN
jgi:hypothetical protein